MTALVRSLRALSSSKRVLLVICTQAIMSTIWGRPTAADDYMGWAPHEHPDSRQFWREAEEEVRGLGSSWFQQKHVTGDWWGQRSILAKWGITPTLTYVSDILGNPVGGRHNKIAYTQSIGADVEIDLEKLAVLKGLTFYISGVAQAGRNLSAIALGNEFTASALAGNETVRLYNLEIEQLLLGDKLSLLLGRFGVDDEFMTSALYSLFLNGAMNDTPTGAPFNLPAFSAYPVAQWGVRALFRPVAEWYVMAGLFNGDRTQERNSNHGVDFSFRHDADIFVIGEIGYLHNRGTDPLELPGNYKFGWFYDSGPFPDLYHDTHGGSYIVSGLPPDKEHQNYGFYILVDQQIHHEAESKTDQGLIPFAGVSIAPSDINIFPYFFMAGLVYNGLLPGRDRDTTGFGIVCGRFSNDLRRSQRNDRADNGASAGVQDFEMVLELTYEFELGASLIIQPDIQYIIQPGGTGRIPDALVLGAQFSANF